MLLDTAVSRGGGGLQVVRARGEFLFVPFYCPSPQMPVHIIVEILEQVKKGQNPTHVARPGLHYSTTLLQEDWLNI